MRQCPRCGERYDDAAFCPVDGTSLIPPEERGALAGTAIDERYFLETRIGSGGLGEVYRGRHIKMAKEVAVKVLRSDSEVFARRFEREARVLARLRHPCIVEVSDFGQTELGPYLVMELLTGVPLSHYTRGEGLPLGRALTVLCGVLEGLAHAHGQGVVHRDLKPDNIMLEGEALAPKILDFGLVKLLPGAQLAGGDEALTAPGTIVGTPAYLAPERVLAAAGAEQPLDELVDIYAVGVLLYELCCGRKPFPSADVRTLVRQHLTEKPPAPRALRPELPEAIEAVILRAMAKRPADRYRSADDLRRAIEALLPLDPTLALRPPPSADAAASAPEPDSALPAAAPAAPVAAAAVSTAAPAEQTLLIASEVRRRRLLLVGALAGAALLLTLLLLLL